MAKSWQPLTNKAGYDTPRGQEAYGDQSRPSKRERSDAQGATTVNPIDLPMAANARESLKYVCIDSETTFGVGGKAANLGINELKGIDEADYYDDDGYECPGLNVATGRSDSTKFTGRK